MQGSIGSSGTQYLNIPAQVSKAILETIKKGDIDGVRSEIEKYLSSGDQGDISSILQQIHDEKYHHNSIFYATLIKDEQQCMRMVEFLVHNGVDAATQDKLNQTALYYACRDGKFNLAELLVKLGCNVNH